MTGYSDDLRERVIRNWQNGHMLARQKPIHNVLFCILNTCLTSCLLHGMFGLHHQLESC